MLDTIRSPRQVLLGAGSAQAMSDLCRSYGDRILVITDAIISAQPRTRAIIDDIVGAFGETTVFSEASPDVPLSDIAAAVDRADGVEPDMIVAIGGGSVIDLAKAVAVILSHGGVPSDYYGEARVPGPVIPLIAVPTTSGTGSEATPVSVVHDDELGLKIGISSVFLVPDVAVVDPELTLTCPPSVTAHAGLDAFAHAVESFTASPREVTPQSFVSTVFRGENLFSDEFAPRTVRLIAENLERVVADGSDLAGREAMSIAALLGGLSFAHGGTACAHALQYRVGHLSATPHGLGVGLLLPYTIPIIARSRADRVQMLAAAVGLDTEGRSPIESAREFTEWVFEFRLRVGLPDTLQQIGIGRDDLRDIAERTSTGATRLLQNHPGPTDSESLLEIVEKAWTGDRSFD